MGFLVKLLSGKLGSYFASGAALLLLVSLLTSCVQTKRLGHAKADLAAARAAQFVPGADGKPTRLTWKAKAQAAERDLGTCRANTDTLTHAVADQNAALGRVEAAGREATARADKAAQQARQARQSADRAATAILNARAGPDRCASALSILKGGEG